MQPGREIILKPYGIKAESLTLNRGIVNLREGQTILKNVVAKSDIPLHVGDFGRACEKSFQVIDGAL
jgi:hypothetical protein